MLRETDIRILLIEDNPGDADLIEAYLESDPRVRADLHRAETLAEALDAVASDPELEIALLDLSLPDSEGIETLQRLRDAAPSLPIVLLTGSRNQEMVWAAVQRGADDYLPKDELTPELLARSIRYTLDRAAAEREIRRRGQWFRSLVESVTDLVLTIDRKGVIAYVSPSGEEILGYDPDELQGTNVMELVHPDDRGRATEALDELLEGADRIEFQLPVQTAAGEWRVVAGDARNLMDTEAVHGIVVTGRDITEAVDREKLLKSQAEELTERIEEQEETEWELRRKDAILEAVSVASEHLLTAGGLGEVVPHVLETLGRATGMGEVALWSLSGEGTEGQAAAVIDEYRWAAEGGSASTIGFPGLFDEDLDWLDRLRKGESVHVTLSDASGEALARLEDQGIQSLAVMPVVVDGELWGALRFLDLHRSHRWSDAEVDALDVAGAILGAAVQRRHDEEKIRERDQELLQAQKMEAVGRLAGGIAHDFNNLLTAIGGYASFISEHVSEVSGVENEIQEIQRAADRGGRLTRQLLAFSRQQVVEEKPIDPGRVVEEIEPLLRQLIGEHIGLSTRVLEERHAIRMDPSQLEQILMNLVLNARDALEEGGKIQITVESESIGPDGRPMLPDVPPAGHYARVTVRDDGAGMDAGTRDKVFEPFFTTKEQGVGTGLGLATVYGIVEGVGGYIGLISEPCVGTEIVILIPATDEAVEMKSEERSDTGRDVVSGTVLVVEDEDGVRGVAVRTLERSGYSVIAAENGREALEKVEDPGVSIDVVLTDVVMPEIGGVELASRLRERFPAVKILLTSGYTQDELVQKRLDDRKLAFIPKPYTPAELRRKVAALNRQTTAAE